MSGRAQKEPSPSERRLVLVGGAREVLDDAFKDFIVEWLVPALVEEYIRFHSNGAICQEVKLLEGDHSVK